MADALLWAGRIKGLQLHMAHFTVKAPSLLPMQGRIQFTETSVNPLRPLGNVPLGESQAAPQQCAIARFMVHGKVGIQHARDYFGKRIKRPRQRQVRLNQFSFFKGKPTGAQVPISPQIQLGHQGFFRQLRIPLETLNLEPLLFIQHAIQLNRTIQAFHGLLLKLSINVGPIQRPHPGEGRALGQTAGKSSVIRQLTGITAHPSLRKPLQQCGKICRQFTAGFAELLRVQIQQRLAIKGKVGLQRRPNLQFALGKLQILQVVHCAGPVELSIAQWPGGLRVWHGHAFNLSGATKLNVPPGLLHGHGERPA